MKFSHLPLSAALFATTALSLAPAPVCDHATFGLCLVSGTASAPGGQGVDIVSQCFQQQAPLIIEQNCLGSFCPLPELIARNQAAIKELAQFCSALAGSQPVLTTSTTSVVVPPPATRSTAPEIPGASETLSTSEIPGGPEIPSGTEKPSGPKASATGVVVGSGARLRVSWALAGVGVGGALAVGMLE